MQPVTIAESRSLLVPKGSVVKTDYVAIDRIRLACKDRMAIGDVERAFNRRLQLGHFQAWPCPRGEWTETPSSSSTAGTNTSPP